MDDPADVLRLVRSRIVVAAIACSAAFSIVAARLVEVMGFGAGLATADLAPAARPMRADLVDRNGVLIARHLPVSDRYVSPAVLWDADEAAHALAAVPGRHEQ